VCGCVVIYWLFTLAAISYDLAVLYICIDMTVAGALLFVRAVVRVPVRGTVYGREDCRGSDA
jgi:hypothetical protein